VPLVVFAALAIHAAGGFEYILWVEAVEGSGLQYLIHGVLGDHHPRGSVRHWKRLVRDPVDDPDHPPSRTRSGQEPQESYLPHNLRRRVYSTGRLFSREAILPVSRLACLGLSPARTFDRLQDGCGDRQERATGGGIYVPSNCATRSRKIVSWRNSSATGHRKIR
jgi:hypothetical protein